MTNNEIRALATDDREQWDVLYRGYADFYRVAQTDAMRDRVWGWLMDAGHEVSGIVAVRDGALVGLAHHRPFARPLAASTGLFLDDLFVTPQARGTGVVDALLARLAEIARAEGHSVVRWITQEGNARARAVYDRVGAAIPFATYDMPV